ncbi:hypothetical protein [Streptomyces inhibens]|uniref:hypothetical protein n=1 Tax=Streptomyces inhibens TaxID=2293571 RepID=UPI001EE74107|nr:hypothetical protein [Streptomyces inhibens]UKY54652.1 hypothetical protein KI385_41555 [Streptomyces inhibens]
MVAFDVDELEDEVVQGWRQPQRGLVDPESDSVVVVVGVARRVIGRGLHRDGTPVSPVLDHHNLQFPTPSWKQVRARLGAGTPHTAATPDHDFSDETAIDHRQRQPRSYRDSLGFDVAAHTLFVVGSSTAFREHGTALRGLVDQAPSYRHRSPDAGHLCVELSPGPRSRARTRPLAHPVLQPLADMTALRALSHSSRP